MHELIPIAEEALRNDCAPSVKVTALQLFKKIILENKEQSLSNLDSYIPHIINALSTKSTFQLKIESLHILTELT